MLAISNTIRRTMKYSNYCFMCIFAETYAAGINWFTLLLNKTAGVRTIFAAWMFSCSLLFWQSTRARHDRRRVWRHMILLSSFTAHHKALSKAMDRCLRTPNTRNVCACPRYLMGIVGTDNIVSSHAHAREQMIISCPHHLLWRDSLIQVLHVTYT